MGSKSRKSPAKSVPPQRVRWIWVAGVGLGAVGLAVSVISAVWLKPAAVKTTTVAPSATASSASPPRFAPTVPNATRSSSVAPTGMVWIPGGEFSMGAPDPPGMDHVGMQATEDSRPVHRVYVDGFWMDATEVTNAQFAEFVRATGYVTIAEQKPKAEDFPDAPPENLVAGSTVFTSTAAPVPLDNHFRWWRYEPGASWRHPEGPGSTIKGREQYPVVQVAYPDALAYAEWAGKRLPTEAEWEFAARGGLSGQPYEWGDELQPGGQYAANTFQGRFPVKDKGEDGYAGIAPVARFKSNGYGAFDMAGNVWEWCSDWYRSDYYEQLAAQGGVARNPRGPDMPYDPLEPKEKKRVHRGGSFLCTDQDRSRYMVGTRGKGEVTTGADHLGFRCVKS